MRILTALFLFLAAPAPACGPDTDCKVGDRIYRIAVPKSHDSATPLGAVIWSHGYRGTAAGVMRNGSLRKMVAAQGIALIAVEAKGGGWNLPNGPRTMNSTGAAEFAYFAAVIADVAQKFDVAPSKLVASGFSAGGMMVWNLACARPDLFAGFVPYSGTYWKEPPATCAHPSASIVHIHGDNDRTVPLTGRNIGATKQGEVMVALDHYAAFGGFDAPVDFNSGKLRCTKRGNPTGDVLEYCLFPGGHSFRTEYLASGT